MYVEILDGQYAGQMRDIEPGTALSLIALGRAKRAFGEPTPAVVATAATPTEPKANVPAKHPGHKKNR